MNKVKIHANPKCKYCLGSGVSQGLFTGATQVCSCVTEQLSIVTVKKDYDITDRYTPGQPEFIKK